ncbi:RING finger protein nhl-1 [Oopsacas minuta]|uniref:RING finger protein nhl-1 n=1 Tax=Oopsacas minuta TaxID=111878 RepID=A0AAV7KG24_9METZ|nr:RING finger protein nhl-1 [Oopsacas minuta]
MQFIYSTNSTQIAKQIQQMSARLPELEAPLVIDPTEASINNTFDRLVLCLNDRRVQLINEFRLKQKDKQAAETVRIKSLEELSNAKANLQAQMKQDLLHSMRENIMKDIVTKIKQLDVKVKETEVRFDCKTQELEESISVLGQLVEREIISTPNYPALLQPSISVGEKFNAVGIAYDETSQLIYVADGNGSICVISITGKYIVSFCKGQVHMPSGIAISGRHGSGIGEFHIPRSITIAPNKDVFITDSHNNRVVVMTPQLKHKQYITHNTMTRPSDLKFQDNKVYILSSTDNPCLHVFNSTGEKLRSFISCSKEGNEQVGGCYSFCFDKKQNIIMGDSCTKNIKVFSQEGSLLHRLGDTQEEDKRIRTEGIVVTSDNKIICASFLTKFALHIFC